MVSHSEVKVSKSDSGGFQVVLRHNQDAFRWFRIVSIIGSYLLKFAEK
jgi:hypothetical protein